MRRTLKTTPAAAVLLILAACGSNNSNTFPEAVITSVTPAEVTAGAELTVTGRNYYTVTGAGGTRIEACGVTVNGSLVEPLTRTILLPPGSTITAEVGSTITGTLPEEGFTAGSSDVRVTRPDGSTAVLESAVTCVIPAPEPEPEPTPVAAAFTTSATTAVAPAAITFNAAGSTGEGELEYAWDFGIEGATASGAEVAYEYLEAGAFTVTLTVTDETGAEATASQEVVIHPALQARIVRSGVMGHAPVTITFDGTRSSGIAPLTFAWDFGDDSEGSSAAEPEHRYELGGTYTVTLTVTDANGESDTAELEIHIPTAVSAAITASSTTGVAPAAITFNAAGSTGEGELEYAWDFGVEGATASGAEVTYAYLEAGTFTVTLTVTDEAGAEVRATQEIVIHPVLRAVIEHAEITSFAPVTVTFDATNSTGVAPLTYAWDFGVDEATSTEAETSYEYEEGGSYTVKLTVTDANGESDTAELELVIPAATPVDAVFTADPITGTAPLTVNFSALNSSGEGELEYEWDFVFNNGTSEVPEPQFTFAVGGTYTVSLTVTDETGATDSATQVIAVDPVPANVSFAIDPAELEVDMDVLVEGENVLRLIRLPDGTIYLPPGEYNLVPQGQARTETINGREVYSYWNGGVQDITVAEGEERVVTLEFTPRTGAIDFTQANLPEPGDYSDSVTIEALGTTLGLPADTSNLNRLVPGVYELTSASISVPSGSESNGTAFITEYEPVEASVQLAISSGDPAEHEFNYRVVPVSSVSLGNASSLPDGLQPNVRLLKPDSTPVPEPWTNLTPGHYQLEFTPVDYADPEGIERQDGTKAPAYQRWIPDMHTLDIYLSSNQTATIPMPEYTLQDAVLVINIEAPEGTGTADVLLTTTDGQEHHFTEATDGDIELTMPLGEYQIAFNTPPGYRLTTQPAAGYHLLDTSRNYYDAETIVSLEFEYEAVSAVPVTINVTPDNLTIPSLAITAQTETAVGTTLINPSTPINLELPPGGYGLHHNQTATSTVMHSIDDEIYTVNSTYHLDGNHRFDVYEDPPNTVSVSYHPVAGKAQFEPQNQPPDSTITYELQNWNGASWQTLTDPDFENLIPGVYEVTGHAVTGSGINLSTGAVRFALDSAGEAPVLLEFPSLPSVTFTVPGAGERDVFVDIFTTDDDPIYASWDTGEPPVQLAGPGDYYAIAHTQIVDHDAGGYLYTSYEQTPPFDFTINSTDSGVITINLPALQPMNALITVTSNLDAEHGPAISKVERHNNDTGNWDEVSTDLSRTTLELVPGTYRFTTKVITIDRGDWIEVLAAADEHIIESLSSGQATSINLEYELLPSLGLSINSTAPLPAGTTPLFTLTDGSGESFTQDDESIPPGTYTATYHRIDAVNPAGRNGTSATYERWSPNPLVQTVNLSSNQQLPQNVIYSLSKPAIRLTVTAPDDAIHPFTGDVWLRRQYNPGNTQVVGRHSNAVFELDFDRYCVEAHDTTHFVVTSNSHENACFQLVTSYDYVGGEHVVDVVIHYDSRPITGTLNVTNTTGNTVPAGSTLAYEFEINSPDSEFDEIENSTSHR